MSKRQILALDLLRVAFAGGVLLRVEVTRVGAPTIRVIVRQAKGLEQRLELEEDLIFAAAKTYAKTSPVM